MKRDTLQSGMRTLWDLLPGWGSASEPASPPPKAPKPAHRRGAIKQSASEQKYDAMTRHMLKEHGVRVRKWRSSSSGVAWQVTYRDGTVSRLIESPRPRGPISAAIFLHEIGHHAIGFNRYKPRCLEEYHAWMYSLEQMERWDLNITERVHDRVHDSLHYAVLKARRRGLKRLPAELVPYMDPRPNRERRMRTAANG
ncbi:MAG: hypothetical protein AAFN41_03835 [Planctomycetota bacterium]